MPQKINRKKKTIKKRKKTKKTKKTQKGGNYNKKILNYINNINIDSKNKCKKYESIKKHKENYIKYCNKTVNNIEGKLLPLCYVDVIKSNSGNIYNCNSINEGNDYQKIQNFHTGLKQSQYTFNNEYKNKNINEDKGIISNIFNFLKGYNPIMLKNKIKKLEDKIQNLEFSS